MLQRHVDCRAFISSILEVPIFHGKLKCSPIDFISEESSTIKSVVELLEVLEVKLRLVCRRWDVRKWR